MFDVDNFGQKIMIMIMIIYTFKQSSSDEAMKCNEKILQSLQNHFSLDTSIARCGG